MFGEGPAERRERLKSLISELGEDEIAQKLKKKEELERREEESQNVSLFCIFNFVFLASFNILSETRICFELGSDLVP